MRIAVLGVGLIGGSIGLAARRRADAQVSGYDADARVLARALELGAIDRAADGVADAVAGADVVFVATPVGALAVTVREALEAAPEGCVVTDVGSTKRVVADASADERFVGGHPLAGAETAGVEHAREDLFDGAVWYLTPAPSTAGVLYERLHRLLAVVSHLPHVLANVLVAQAASALGEAADGRVPAVGPSFRDVTRIAGANSAIWTDIYISNRDALLGAIDELSARVARVRAALAADDAPAVTEWNDAARTERERLLGAGLTGGSVAELRVSVPNRPGVIAQIALALGGAGVNIRDLALAPSQDNRQGVVSLWLASSDDAARASELIAGLGFPVAQA